MIRLAAAAVVLLSLAPAASAARPSACKLLTPVQVRAALGAKIAWATSNGAASCAWHGTAPASSPVRAELRLDFEPVPTRARFRTIANGNWPPMLPVRGAGDLAFRMPDESYLIAWREGYMVSVSAFYVSHPVTTEKRVAEIALARLGSG